MTIPDLNPLGYTGLKQRNPPNVYYFEKDPLPTNIIGFDIGDFWINTATNSSFQLMSVAAVPPSPVRVAVWDPIGGGGEIVSTLTTSTNGVVGVVVSPVTGNIIVDGESGISTSSTGNGNFTVSFNGAVPENVLIYGAQPGGNRYLTVSNSDATGNPGSNAQILTQVTGPAEGNPYFQSEVIGAQSWVWGIDTSDSTAWVLGSGGNIGTNNVIRIKPTATGGYMNFPSQPAFSSHLSVATGAITGDGTTYTIVCDTVDVDQLGNYNNANGKFTAPISGVYQFTCATRYVKGATVTTGITFTLVRTPLVGPAVVYSIYSTTDATIIALTENAASGSVTLPLVKGDVVSMQLTVSGTALSTIVRGPTAGAGYNTYFCGSLLC